MKYIIAGLIISSVLPCTSYAKIITPDNQTDLNITIYNEDRALVSDTRNTTLTQGFNSIAFSDISSQIIAQSALLSGNNILLIEQNFNYDLLSESSLLEKALGSGVFIEYTNPVTGEVKTQSAELLAVNGSQPVLKINGKIETQYPGRIIFNKVPENLWPTPTLVMDIKSNIQQNIPLSLSYLTKGLSWQADYVAQLNETESRMTLNGLVTLTNHSGTAYKNASIQLVAGDVNIVNDYIQPRIVANRLAMTAEMTGIDKTASVEKLSDFYLYTLPHKTDILSNQTKQIALLSAQNIPIKKTYEFDNTLNMEYTSEIKKVRPSMYLNFENKKENNLGIALPKGIIRLYKKDLKNNMLFVGEDKINHSANLENIRLKMGQAFDITANGKRVSHIKKDDKTIQSSYEITISNGGTNDTTVDIYQYMPNQWKITAQNIPYAPINANRIKWSISVPAQNETKLSYTLEVTK